MNKTSIEWCNFTWNPVTGCFHSCRNIYCYNTIKKTSPLNRFGAKYQDTSSLFVYEKNWKRRESGEIHEAKPGEVYPFGYDPTFYPHRLSQPLKVKTPGRIFTVDTGDLFGKWVPSIWIENVLSSVHQCPWHTFIFLSKNPSRFQEFTFPENAWIGTTVNSDKDQKRADILQGIDAPVRFLSIEPLLGEISFSLEGFQWIIIGAQTGGNPVKPDSQWIADILKNIDLDVPVFMKNNLKSFYAEIRQEFPG
jgi:protein gp37